VSPPEAEVHLLDLEQPPMCEVGAEGCVNTGVVQKHMYKEGRI
jgi:hypothetical protein